MNLREHLIALSNEQVDEEEGKKIRDFLTYFQKYHDCIESSKSEYEKGLSKLESYRENDPNVVKNPAFRADLGVLAFFALSSVLIQQAEEIGLVVSVKDQIKQGE